MLADHVLIVHWEYPNWFATWLHLRGVVPAPSLVGLSSTRLHSQLFRQLQLQPRIFKLGMYIMYNFSHFRNQRGTNCVQGPTVLRSV